jgi:hypothetical protein
MEELHTADNVEETVQDVRSSWKVAGGVHIFLRQHGPGNYGIRSLGCYAHSLQHRVKRAVACQLAENASSVCNRRIITRLFHSALAKENFKISKWRLPTSRAVDCPLKQDIATR